MRKYSKKGNCVSRTWQADVSMTEVGVYTLTHNLRLIIKATKEGGVEKATVNGQPYPLEAAKRLVAQAKANKRLKVLEEVYEKVG